MGARYYDPNIGRFTQPDPSGQEKNPYLYAEGDPVNRIDPTGLLPKWLTSTGNFLKSKGPRLLGKASSAAPVGCYAKKAWEDTDNSLSDEASDLNSCFNPYAWVTE